MRLKDYCGRDHMAADCRCMQKGHLISNWVIVFGWFELDLET